MSDLSIILNTLIERHSLTAVLAELNYIVEGDETQGNSSQAILAAALHDVLYERKSKRLKCET